MINAFLLNVNFAPVNCVAILQTFSVIMHFFQHQENAEVGSRSAENLEMLKRITVILLTDVICWISMCVTSLVIRQLPVKNNFKIGSSFRIATLVLVPLNSVINSYIYSIYLWGRLLKNYVIENCSLLVHIKQIAASLK